MVQVLLYLILTDPAVDFILWLPLRTEFRPAEYPEASRCRLCVAADFLGAVLVAADFRPQFYSNDFPGRL